MFRVSESEILLEMPSSRLFSLDLVQARRVLVAMPLALSIYLYIERFFPGLQLGEFNHPLEIVAILGSLALGGLCSRLIRSRNVFRFPVYFAFLVLGADALNVCGKAYFTTSSWYFELCTLVTLSMLAGHFLKDRRLKLLLLLGWIGAMGSLQFYRLTGYGFRASIIYIGLLVWFMTLCKFIVPKGTLLLRNALLATLLIAFPIRENRYLALTVNETERIGRQAGVETLFTAGSNDAIPEHRMEMTCNPVSGKLIVSPHAIDRHAGIIDRSGKVARLELGGESPDRSVAIGPLWLTTAKGKLVLFDTVANRHRAKQDLGLSDVYYLHYLADVGLLAISQARPIQCQFFSAMSDGTFSRLYQSVVGEECIPLDAKTILISQHNRQDVVSLYDFETRTVTKSIKKRRGWGIFYQVAVDVEQRKLYVPQMFSGMVDIYDLDTFAWVSRFTARPGVRNVLVDSNNPRRVFSWNYATGEVIEHRMPNGEKTRSWTLGPLLRTLNWDCNEQDLLAATSVGGFRIHPD